MPKIEILVVVNHRKRVSVRWLKPLDRVGGGVYRALKETLEEIEGVESVTVRRYSAELEVAPHVASAAEVATVVTAELLDRNGEFQYALRFAMQNPEVDVQNVGEVETL